MMGGETHLRALHGDAQLGADAQEGLDAEARVAVAPHGQHGARLGALASDGGGGAGGVRWVGYGQYEDEAVG